MSSGPPRGRARDGAPARPAASSSMLPGTSRTSHQIAPRPAAAPSSRRTSTFDPQLPSRLDRPRARFRGLRETPAGVVPRPARDRDDLVRGRPRSFFDDFAYALAYFAVISARDCTDSSLPMPSRSPFRGQSQLRHRRHFADIFRESRRTMDKAMCGLYDHTSAGIDLDSCTGRAGRGGP